MLICYMINLNTEFKNLTILYVEDENDIRENLSSTLKLMFDTVYSVQTAELGLKIYNEKHIDIILSDIGLPQMSGIDFIEIIREKNKNIPVILLTAYTQTDILLKAIKLKLVSYLTKPINLDTLTKALLDAKKELTANTTTTTITSFPNNIIYDSDKKLLSQNEKDLHITASEDKLLNILIENKLRTLSIDELKNMIWEDSYLATDSAFKSLLNKLRKKIGTNSIKNRSGLGYYLNI